MTALSNSFMKPLNKESAFDSLSLDTALHNPIVKLASLFSYPKLMKNKISYSNKVALLLLVGLSAIAYGVVALEKSTPIKLDLTTNPFTSTFSTIHFNAGGNDF